MQVGRWLLWVTWLYTWAEGSRQCQCTCLPEPGLAEGSKTQVKDHKEHVRHRLEHLQHRPHRDRPHRRKGKHHPSFPPDLAQMCFEGNLYHIKEGLMSSVVLSTNAISPDGSPCSTISIFGAVHCRIEVVKLGYIMN